MRCDARSHLHPPSTPFVRGSSGPGATQATRMTWDADVLIDLVNDDHGPMDWRAVAEGLDFPEADLSRPEVPVATRIEV